MIQQILEYFENLNLYHNMMYYLNKYSNNWEKYIRFDKDKEYTRNLIYKNSELEIYLICWNKNTSSVIHDHPKNGCIMKILQGELTELLYDKNLNLIKKSDLKEGSIKYIDDNIGLHRIINGNNKSISLHIYSPPNFISKKYSKL